MSAVVTKDAIPRVYREGIGGAGARQFKAIGAI